MFSRFLTSAGTAIALLTNAYAFDIVLHNGNVVTLDPARPRAQALAINGDTIASTGDSADLLARALAATRKIDLHGRTVIPGLIDSHMHAIRAGLTYADEVSWIDVPDLKSALARIAQKALETPPDDIIVVAGGWNVQQFAEQRPPTLQELEAAAPGRAVYLQWSYRAVLMTQPALQKLDISDASGLPPGARFEMDAQGQRTGWIAGDAAAIIALFDRLPRFDTQRHVAGTRRFFARLNAFGITGVIDPGGHNLRLAEYDALFEMAKRDLLTLRVAFSLFAPQRGRERADFERLVPQMKARARPPMLQFNGIGENIAWSLYNNDAPGSEDVAAFEDVAEWAARSGLRLTVHWNNAKSAPVLLDAFARIGKRTPYTNLRWSVAHLHDATPDIVERLKELNLGWHVQNAGYFAAPSWLRERGASARVMSPLATALRTGLPVGGGTDAHRVMSFNPFLSLRWMIDGVTAGGLSTRGPDELLTREEALRVYTEGSAWFTGEETRRGRLAPGYMADLAVLDLDYMSAPLSEFGRLMSDLTMVGGRIVHAGAPFAAYRQVETPP